MMQAETKVADLMSKNVLSARTENSFTELSRLFIEMGIHHLPVIDPKGRLVGLLSATDVIRAYNSLLPKLEKIDEESLNQLLPVRDIMTPNPLRIKANVSINEAARLFRRFRIQSLPVVESGRVIGILTTRDLLKHFSENDPVVIQ